MKPIEIRAEAELDIIEAALWYENEREGFGVEFSLEVERAVARIAENQLMFQEREVGMRMAKVGRFPTVCISSTSSTRSYYLASSILIAIPRFGSIGGEVPPSKPLQRSPSAPSAERQIVGRTAVSGSSLRSPGHRSTGSPRCLR